MSDTQTAMDLSVLLEPDGKMAMEEAEKSVAEDGGLISEEFFKYNLGAIYDYAKVPAPGHAMTNLRFKHKDYLPLYAVNFKLDQSLPVSQLTSGNFEMSDYEKQVSMKLGSSGNWQANTIYVNFLKKCLETKQYNMILFLKHNVDSIQTTREGLRNKLTARFNEFINSPVDLKIYREGRYNAKNYADIMSNVKYYSGWSKSRTKRANISDPVVFFLTNFYYMAKLNELNGRFWIEPMFSVMIKKEYLPYIRACMMTNTPIPVDALELWIDYKLDKTDSTYKIRSSFVKSIKTPFKNAGVKIVVHEDLFPVLYERPTLPKFKTVAERQDWIKNLSRNLVQKELRQYVSQGAIPGPLTPGPSYVSWGDSRQAAQQATPVDYEQLLRSYGNTVQSLTQ